MFDLTETDRLLATTRSVRRRLDLDRPVDARWCSTASASPCRRRRAATPRRWRWLVVDDRDHPARPRRPLPAHGRSLPRRLPRSSPGPDGHPTSDQTRRVLDSAKYLADVMADVPVLVIPCIKGRLDDAAPALAASFYGSILPAVWSFQLALRSRGLGSCLTTLHLAHEAEAGRAARHPRRRHAGGAPAGGLHRRRRLLAGTGAGRSRTSRTGTAGRIDEVGPVLGVLGQPGGGPAHALLVLLVDEPVDLPLEPLEGHRLEVVALVEGEAGAVGPERLEPDVTDLVVARLATRSSCRCSPRSGSTSLTSSRAEPCGRSGIW